METFQNWLMTIQQSVPGDGLRVLYALVLLPLAWVAARVVGAASYRVLKSLDVDGFAAQFGEGSEPKRFERLVSRVLYYTVLVLGAAVVLDVVGLSTASAALKDVVFGIIAGVPGVLKAGLIMAVAWGLARIAKSIGSSALEKWNPEQHFARLSGEKVAAKELKQKQARTTQIGGEVAYYVVLLMGVAPALGAMGLTELSAPLRSIVDDVVAVVPRLVGAGLTLFVGWMLSRVARRGITALVATTGADEGAEKLGLSKFFKDQKASQLLGSLTYWVILIPVAIGAIEALQLKGLSQPLSAALTTVLTHVPNLIAALGIVLLAVVAGRWVGSMLKGLAETFGANSLLPKIGFGSVEDKAGDSAPSEIFGKVGQILVVLFGVMQGLEVLGLTALTAMLQSFVAFLPNAALALAIMGIGFFFGNLLKEIIDEHIASREDDLLPSFFGTTAKIIVVGFAAMAACLQVGLAEALIVNGFSILFGSICLAMALAFGLGAKEKAGEIAGEILERGQQPSRPKLKRTA